MSACKKDLYNCYCNPPDECKKRGREWCILGGDTEEDLKWEILRQMAEQKKLQDEAKKWEKSDYRMKKDQLFRRLQVEKEERQMQQCFCKAEYDKSRREQQIVDEENFAEAIKELKEDEVRDSAFRKQLYNCSPEIRELQRELRRAYYAKTLYAQRLEGEAKKLEEKMRQQENYEMLMEKLQQFDADEEKKQQAEHQKMLDYRQALTNQLQDATSKMAKKKDEFDKDKAMIDEIVSTIEQEEIKDLVEKNNKIQLYRDEIKHFLDSRDFHREREKNRNKMEDQKITEFLNAKEDQRAAFNKLKAERDAAKASIVAKAIERIMQAQFKNEEMEELRRELYEEELAEQVRRREAEEKEKRLRQMAELRAAEAEAKQLRCEKLAADKAEEEEYRKQLTEKFAEDDRLEQMGYTKRRQREIAHRKKVEEMILERRALKAQLRERELEARNCFDEETQRRKDLVEQERFKLLHEHGPKLLGFIPRGVIQSKEELEKLGEPFVSYYRNDPNHYAPDPSTIDFSPCEEEIFKNMKLSRSIKY